MRARRLHVVPAPVLRGDSILMVRHVHDGRDHWTLPGGGVESGETPRAAALRELTEETGLTGDAGSRYHERGYRRREGRDVIEEGFSVRVPHDYEPELGDGLILVDVAWRPNVALAADPQVPLVCGRRR